MCVANNDVDMVYAAVGVYMMFYDTFRKKNKNCSTLFFCFKILLQIRYILFRNRRLGGGRIWVGRQIHRIVV